jgi:hypothetical protein
MTDVCSFAEMPCSQSDSNTPVLFTKKYSRILEDYPKSMSRASSPTYCLVVFLGISWDLDSKLRRDLTRCDEIYTDASIPWVASIVFCLVYCLCDVRIACLVPPIVCLIFPTVLQYLASSPFDCLNPPVVIGISYYIYNSPPEGRHQILCALWVTRNNRLYPLIYFRVLPETLQRKLFSRSYMYKPIK